MLPRDFNETFNAAVTSQDWNLVTILGESAVAENSASKDILYNLGLAYLKTNKAPMAVSVFLSVPVVEQDEAFRSARDEAFRMVGASKEDLEIGAHGFTGALTGVAQSISGVDLYGWCVISLGVAMLLAGLISFGKELLHNSTLQFFARLMIAINLIISALSGAGLAVSYYYQSHWGAVIASESAPLRPSASDKADPLKNLKAGKPVLVLGDARTPWVRVLDADGDAGWMNALDLRVIHE